MIIGHKDLIADFKKLAKAGKLAQGYIFFGEPDVGKYYFARHLANFMENGEFDLSPRPLQDAMILKDASGIDEMREIKSFLWQKPVISQKRTIVINNAGNLTPEAQNSILKIVEEPPEHALIILVLSQPENLSPALLSRFQKIHFGRLSDSEMGQVLSPACAGMAQAGVNDKKIISISRGRPGLAMRLKSDPLMSEADELAILFLENDGGARTEIIKKIVELQKEKPELLDMFFEAVISKLRVNPIRDYRKMKATLHRLFLIKSYNVNKRIQLEAI